MRTYKCDRCGAEEKTDLYTRQNYDLCWLCVRAYDNLNFKKLDAIEKDMEQWIKDGKQKK